MINLNTKMKEPSTQGLSIIYDYFQARYDNPKFEWEKFLAQATWNSSTLNTSQFANKLTICLFLHVWTLLKTTWNT